MSTKSKPRVFFVAITAKVVHKCILFWQLL